MAIASLTLGAASPPPVAVATAPAAIRAARYRSHLRTTRVSADALRRDAVRMTRNALLELRHGLLREFLIRASTETPLLRDDAVREPVPGIRLSAAVVSVDFTGDPVIRARVTSTRAQAVYLVLIADIVDARGTHARASTALVVQPGASQVVELACPQRQRPAALRWSAEAL